MSFKCKAIRVRQPIGEFYLTSLRAEFLLKVCFSHPHTRHSTNENGEVEDEGHQRKIIKQRVGLISQYLQSQDATLPGAIILAANCAANGKMVAADSESEMFPKRWRVSIIDDENDLVEIEIPTEEPLAAIVDGQHRLQGFAKIPEIASEFSLPCAIFMDLPVPQQASIFATINFNQKPVNKSQTYELFGYDLDVEEEPTWSPEKLAVYFARRLNASEDSPFRHHIKVAAIDDSILSDVAKNARKEWTISTASIVESIHSLITRDAQRERDELHKFPVEKRSRELLRRFDEGLKAEDKPVFRDIYLSAKNDLVIYKTIVNYFNEVKLLFWDKSGTKALKRTAGIQALFKVLIAILRDGVLETKDFRGEVFRTYLLKATKVDFSSAFFQESSGKGQGQIADALLVSMGLKNVEKVRNEDLRKMLKLIV